ncbi:SH3 domain-binding 2 [Gossypium australe]|uniref:SH3 domain-binding 2 n=1 Tax=Gossypium australe TaxID=47621 RepID=A0A5B6URJ6_9ROSI|nr:SH3 domain-binding 2 [Gossypium australe]
MNCSSCYFIFCSRMATVPGNDFSYVFFIPRGGQRYPENLLLLTILMLTIGFLDSLFFMANVYSSIYAPQTLLADKLLNLYFADLSPQDSTLLSDVVEVGPLPNFIREDEGTQYSFYILTRQGLRYECSHVSEVQVDTWLSALRTDCKLGSDVEVPNGS